LLVIFFVTIIWFIPWQQTIIGVGSVTSFYPQNRPQTIESPIKGRIELWNVKEGDLVNEGDLILSLKDLEKDFLPPKIISLLKESRATLEKSEFFYLKKAQELSRSIVNKEKNLKESLNSAKQEIKAKKISWETAQLNLERTRKLYEEGLSSQRSKELAIRKIQESKAALLKAQIDLEKIRTQKLDEINKIKSERASALAESAKIKNSIIKTQLNLDKANERKKFSQIKSPVQARIIRLFKRGIGETFKENEKIAIIAPETKDQAVELFVRDLDVPLISEGDKVRLQFSGWPAIQLTGVSFHTGTFSGVVTVIDTAITESGFYRILISPLIENNERPWPKADQLRQGTRVTGWVILGTVSLGYELWRRFNNFRLSQPIIKSSQNTKKKYISADPYQDSLNKIDPSKEKADYLYKRKIGK